MSVIMCITLVTGMRPNKQPGDLEAIFTAIFTDYVAKEKVSTSATEPAGH